ncbi:CoA transferase [Verticiella sediminum]|uniref:CoA transferase n=2 Tax=Verticiella sediminum TaxID=1247510 RepID=A0A556B2K2_9BURK|nr:CoA transferase [Verticiella sediminum]
MRIRGRELPADEITIKGQDPVLPTRIKIGEAAADVLAGIGIAVTDIHELRTGRRQQISIDVRHAAAACLSTRLMRKAEADGSWTKDPFMTPAMRHMRTLSQPWQCKDGRWFYPQFNLQHLHDRVIGVLGCESTAEAVASAIAKWDSDDLEQAIAAAAACGAVVRSNAEWLEHPQGRALAGKPVVEITKIGESDPVPFPEGPRPLSGIRALDLTRILAGPITSRTLAEHGADVLMVTASDLPQVLEHVVDTSHGKRSTYLDVRKVDDLSTLKGLVRDADVFSQGYRPGALVKYGLGPEELAKERPGIVYVSISCYGDGGPFSDRRGWEQMAQSCTGLCLESAGPRPKLAPAAVCDYTTGYNGAYGVLLALARRAREGGSYHVKVSLCQSGMFVYRHGLLDHPGSEVGLSDDEVGRIMMEGRGSYGTLRNLAPVLRLSETSPGWSTKFPVLGSSPAEWVGPDRRP